jgi:aromatic-amino-acid transaminase
MLKFNKEVKVMNFLTKQAAIKDAGDDILKISGMAHKAKMLNSDVVNATVGALYTDKSKLYQFQLINYVQATIPNEEMFAYAQTDGGEVFKESALKWIFRDYLNDIKKEMNISVVATVGGSGAISNTLFNYVNSGDSVLLTDIYWGPYQFMINEIGGNIVTHPMFEEDHFNCKAFIEVANKIVKKEGKLVTIINDPCHNPTGYSMSKEEWLELIEYFNSLGAKKVPVIVIYDIAYIDYSNYGKEGSREMLSLIRHTNEYVLNVLTFSGSKTFSIYGLRLGAQIALSKSKHVIEDFERTALYSTRAKWSCPPKIGISILNKLMSTEETEKVFLEELEDARKLIENRSRIFLQEVNQVGLKMHPYKSGFFMSIPSDHPKKLVDDLRKTDIYVVPMDKGIRMAVSSIPTDQIPGLARRMKNVIG